MTACGDCGGTIIEYDAAAGNGFCVRCGTVVEENTIVSEVAFGESSTGAAIVQGSFVAQGATHARMSGPYGSRSTSESREQTIENASRKIRNVAAVMRLSEVVQTAAIRLYTLALEHKFTKGRKNMNVIAVCLYVVCRQKETRNYMLIDFSDLLQVNVFELGHTYLQLVQTLNLRLPLVDPSHYISRFAALLEFGDETPKVAADAVRLVARFDRDWMSRGRRPAGICGACLLLAARMNNFRRSVQEVIQVVKISDATLKQRLDEFKKTPSGALTLADFRTVWLEEEMDPPAFTKAKEKEAKEKGKGKAKEVVQVSGEEGEETKEEEENDGRGKRKGKRRKVRKHEKKRRRVDGNDRESTFAPEIDVIKAFSSSAEAHPPIDPQLLNQGNLAGTVGGPLFLPDPDEPSDEAASSTLHDSTSLVNVNGDLDKTDEPPPDSTEDALEATLREEVNDFLHTGQGTQLADALEEADRRRQARFTGDDELLGLDEAELDAHILSEEEVKIKERVWVEMNRGYLESLAAKEATKVGAPAPKVRKRWKASNNKPRDASTPTGNTAAESVQSMVKTSAKYSRRINYEALQNLFASDSASTTFVPPDEVNLDDKENDMYTVDDKAESDGEGLTVVVEESGGGVGVGAAASTSNGRPEKDLQGALEPEGEEGEEDGEGEEIDLSDKGDEEYAWDEGYEQEV